MKASIAQGALLLLTALILSGCTQAPDWNLANEPEPDLTGQWVAYPDLFSIEVNTEEEGYSARGGALVSVNKSQHAVTFSGRMTPNGRIVSLVGEIEEGKDKTKGLSLVMLGSYKTYDSGQAFLDAENLVKDPRASLEGPVTVLVLRIGLAKKESFSDPDLSKRWGAITHGTSQHLILQ